MRSGVENIYATKENRATSMRLLPLQCGRYQLQRYKHLETVSLLIRKDRATQALRRLRLASAQARERDQACTLHGLAAVRGAIKITAPDPRGF